MKKMRDKFIKVFFGTAFLAPFSAFSATIDLPPTVSANVSSDEAVQPRMLTSPEHATVFNWLRLHQSGWEVNAATPPAGTAHISLDTASRKNAVTLTLWPGPKYPGWSHTILVEIPADKMILVKSLGTDELAPILEIILK